MNKNNLLSPEFSKPLWTKLFSCFLIIWLLSFLPPNLCAQTPVSAGMIRHFLWTDSKLYWFPDLTPLEPVETKDSGNSISSVRGVTISWVSKYLLWTNSKFYHVAEWTVGDPLPPLFEIKDAGNSITNVKGLANQIFWTDQKLYIFSDLAPLTPIEMKDAETSISSVRGVTLAWFGRYYIWTDLKLYHLGEWMHGDPLPPLVELKDSGNSIANVKGIFGQFLWTDQKLYIFPDLTPLAPIEMKDTGNSIGSVRGISRAIFFPGLLIWTDSKLYHLGEWMHGDPLPPLVELKDSGNSIANVKGIFGQFLWTDQKLYIFPDLTPLAPIEMKDTGNSIGSVRGISRAIFSPGLLIWTDSKLYHLGEWMHGDPLPPLVELKDSGNSITNTKGLYHNFLWTDSKLYRFLDLPPSGPVEIKDTGNSIDSVRGVINWSGHYYSWTDSKLLAIAQFIEGYPAPNPAPLEVTIDGNSISFPQQISRGVIVIKPHMDGAISIDTDFAPCLVEFSGRGYKGSGLASVEQSSLVAGITTYMVQGEEGPGMFLDQQQVIRCSTAGTSFGMHDIGMIFLGERETLSDTTAPITTASPPGGTYSSVQNVTLNCNDTGGSGCQITKYCLGDGCVPSITYNGAIYISSYNRLRFYSTDNSNNNESVKTETYTINTPQVTYTITASAGANGSITPSGSVSVNHNATQAFTVSPASGYQAVMSGTCGGNLNGSTYTTNTITADCTVGADFNPIGSSQDLSPGNNVEVSVQLPSGSTVLVEFDQIVTGGTLNVTATSTPPGGGPPSGFKFLGTYYDVTFTGTFSGYLYLTFPYQGSSIPSGKEKTLKLFHWKNNGWDDCTFLLDKTNNKITGRVTSLSPFGIGYTSSSGSGSGSSGGKYATGANENMIAAIAILAILAGMFILRRQRRFRKI